MFPSATGANGFFFLTVTGFLIDEGLASLLTWVADLGWVAFFTGLKSSSLSLQSKVSLNFYLDAIALALGVLVEKLVVSFTSSLGSADLNCAGVSFSLILEDLS